MKYKRHLQILRIIEDNDIETQEALIFELKRFGLDVTQATISRDIKDLGLTKVLRSNGKYVYTRYDNPLDSTSERLVRLFRDSTLSITYAQNIVVVKTFQGAASAAAAAIDSLKIDIIVGTLAGDDTIFLLVKTNDDSLKVIEILKTYMEDK
jgi:transcriptional regulator of arginine metabolism